MFLNNCMVLTVYFYSQMMIRWKLKMTPTVTAAQEKGIKVVTKTHITLCQNQKKSGAELPEMLSRDIENTPPLPEAQHHKTALQKVNSLLFWLLYFLLLWQATCHLSDNGLVWLLKFLISWLKVLAVEISSEVFENVLLCFPGSLYLVRQFLNLDRDDFSKFVVCPKCTKLYKYDSCLEMVNGRQVAKKCTNTYYSRRKKMVCSASMATKVTLQSGKTCFYSIKYYCVRSIIEELEKFLLRKNCASNCQLWRNREMGADLLADVYDGNLWREFQTVNGIPFLQKPRNYGFMLKETHFGVKTSKTLEQWI